LHLVRQPKPHGRLQRGDRPARGSGVPASRAPHPSSGSLLTGTKAMKRLFLVVLGVAACSSARADEFTEADLERWAAQFESVAQEGRRLWTSPELGTNGVACAQCHPNAANTHPETYPKFQKQLGRVAQMWEMVNWCIRNP